MSELDDAKAAVEQVLPQGWRYVARGPLNFPPAPDVWQGHAWRGPDQNVAAWADTEADALLALAAALKAKG